MGNYIFEIVLRVTSTIIYVSSSKNIARKETRFT